MTKLLGGCLCGKIRYEVTAEPINTVICYCRQCQRAAGSERGDGIIIQKAEFQLVQGSMKEHHSIADSGNAVTKGIPTYSRLHRGREPIAYQSSTYIIGTGILSARLETTRR